MTTINLNTTLSHRDDLYTSDLEDEMVMMNLDRGFYYGLETVATVIWKQLAQPHSVVDLVDYLLTRYSDVDRATCEQETLAFLNDLFEEELVVVQE